MLETSIPQKFRIHNDLEVSKNSFMFFKQDLDKSITLHYQGNFKIVIDIAKSFVEKYLSLFFVWNIFGSALKILGNFERASKAFNRVSQSNHLSSSVNIFKINISETWENTFQLVAKDISKYAL